MTLSACVARLTEELSSFEQLKLVLLYGSAARGEMHPDSDLARTDGLFLREVLTEGTVLLQRDPRVRGELIMRMLVFTEDMLPNIRMIRRVGTARFVEEHARWE